MLLCHKVKVDNERFSVLLNGVDEDLTFVDAGGGEFGILEGEPFGELLVEEALLDSEALI